MSVDALVVLLLLPLFPSACGGGGGGGGISPPCCDAAENRSPRNCCRALLIELDDDVASLVELVLEVDVEIESDEAVVDDVLDVLRPI